MSRIFYRGTGRTGGPVAPMSRDDAYFWANRRKTEEARLARGGQPVKQGNANGKH